MNLLSALLSQPQAHMLLAPLGQGSLSQTKRERALTLESSAGGLASHEEGRTGRRPQVMPPPPPTPHRAPPSPPQPRSFATSRSLASCLRGLAAKHTQGTGKAGRAPWKPAPSSTQALCGAPAGQVRPGTGVVAEQWPLKDGSPSNTQGLPCDLIWTKKSLCRGSPIT